MNILNSTQTCLPKDVCQLKPPIKIFLHNRNSCTGSNYIPNTAPGGRGTLASYATASSMACIVTRHLQLKGTVMYTYTDRPSSANICANLRRFLSAGLQRLRVGKTDWRSGSVAVVSRARSVCGTGWSAVSRRGDVSFGVSGYRHIC